MDTNQLLLEPPYGVPQDKKEAWLATILADAVARQRSGCPRYDRVLQTMWPGRMEPGLAGLPYIPVRLFKEKELLSVPPSEVFKELVSSGTTGQRVSRILLDRETATRQAKALASIMVSFLGPQRLPMVIADTKDVLRDRAKFSARGAGILGMANFGRDHFYALNPDMSLDVDGLQGFVDRHAGGPILVFGFTFMVWQHLLEGLPRPIDLHGGILVHSGGWKKLQDKAVDNATFKRKAKAQLNLAKVHNFYGMVEQVGSVFVECEQGWLHAPLFADIIVRDETSWKEAPVGSPGVLELLSVLPTSYPGHCLLTEDRGMVMGVDDCPCGRLGKRFQVLGRIPKAELRGCSDTHAESWSGRP